MVSPFHHWDGKYFYIVNTNLSRTSACLSTFWMAFFEAHFLFWWSLIYLVFFCFSFWCPNPRSQKLILCFLLWIHSFSCEISPMYLLEILWGNFCVQRLLYRLWGQLLPNLLFCTQVSSLSSHIYYVSHLGLYKY